jgi:hypothetical protein
VVGVETGEEEVGAEAGRDAGEHGGDADQWRAPDGPVERRRHGR